MTSESLAAFPPLRDPAPGSDFGLIYDLGMHRGEDSEFYLKKGFRVVAVEADPDLCAFASERLRRDLDEGRLVILNVAISDREGECTFYRNSWSQWGTIKPNWAAMKGRLRDAAEPITVRGVTFDRILATYGEPYFLKIDIEGMDQVALAALSRTGFRPKYLSAEACWPIEDQFALLVGMGYDRFKIVQQRWVKFQRPPRPAREGRDIAHRFVPGASGLFGEEAPGRWLTAEESLQRYRRILKRFRRYGRHPSIGPRLAWLLRRLRIDPGWHDTHARHSSVET